VRVLVVSHLHPSPGVERHLFVHEQILALRERGIDMQVRSPIRNATRVFCRDPAGCGTPPSKAEAASMSRPERSEPGGRQPTITREELRDLASHRSLAAAGASCADIARCALSATVGESATNDRVLAQTPA